MNHGEHGEHGGEPQRSGDGRRQTTKGATDAKGLVYLATPYSHPDRAVREFRFRSVNKAAAFLMKWGYFVFSPISHTHPIAEAGDLPLGWDYWEKYDREILKACSKLIVFMIEGWKESKGVAGEIAIAKEMGIPVEYWSVEDTLKGGGK